MKGFKDTTKTVKGHCFSSGGIVPGGGGGMSGVRMGSPSVRPVMPRPHVMPTGKPTGMRPMAKLAGGGRYGAADGGGGPYDGGTSGNSLEQSNRPYSEAEKLHPRRDARPGYKKGGKTMSTKKVRKIADQGLGKHVATPKPKGHGMKAKGGLGAFNRAPLFGK